MQKWLAVMVVMLASFVSLCADPQPETIPVAAEKGDSVVSEEKQQSEKKKSVLVQVGKIVGAGLLTAGFAWSLKIVYDLYKSDRKAFNQIKGEWVRSFQHDVRNGLAFTAGSCLTLASAYYMIKSAKKLLF